MLLGSNRYPANGEMLVAPSAGGRLLTLRWDAQPPANSYIVYIAERPDMSGPVVSWQGPDLARAFLLPVGVYYWYVSAQFLGAGTVSETPVWAFGVSRPGEEVPIKPPDERWDDYEAQERRRRAEQEEAERRRQKAEQEEAERRRREEVVAPPVLLYAGIGLLALTLLGTSSRRRNG